MRVQNLEQFLKSRDLNFKVVVGPRWESEDAKGKVSEDKFYIISSSLEKLKTVKSVWRKGEFSSSVVKAINELGLDENKVIYTHDIDKALKEILRQGEKAYNAHIIRTKREHKIDDVECDGMSSKFEKTIKYLKK